MILDTLLKEATFARRVVDEGKTLPKALKLPTILTSEVGKHCPSPKEGAWNLTRQMNFVAQKANALNRIFKPSHPGVLSKALWLKTGRIWYRFYADCFGLRRVSKFFQAMLQRVLQQGRSSLRRLLRVADEVKRCSATSCAWHRGSDVFRQVPPLEDFQGVGSPSTNPGHWENSMTCAEVMPGADFSACLKEAHEQLNSGYETVRHCKLRLIVAIGVLLLVQLVALEIEIHRNRNTPGRAGNGSSFRKSQLGWWCWLQSRRGDWAKGGQGLQLCSNIKLAHQETPFLVSMVLHWTFVCWFQM